MSDLQQFNYRLFGLRIASQIELPELAAADPSEEPDVWIRQAVFPDPMGHADELVVRDDGAEFHINGVARYLISQGSEIFVDAASQASPRNVRLFLLGSAMALLLHQRGSLPLHANAIEIDGRAYAFMGPSGSGKSTLAAAFHERGCQVIADDVCVVSLATGGLAVAHAGIPRLRLREDALLATGRETNDFERSYVGDDDYRKFDVPLPCAQETSVPLAAIILLSPGDEVRLSPLEGADAVGAIFANTYRGSFIPKAGDAAAHWRACMELVSTVPLFRLDRPMERRSIDQIIKILEERIGLIGS